MAEQMPEQVTEEQPVEAQPPPEPPVPTEPAQPLEPPAPPVRPRRRWSRLIGPLTTGLLCLGLITLLVAQLVQANELLKTQLADRNARIAADQSHVSALEAQIKDLKERWFGTPALYQPPAIANTDIEFFPVDGTSQLQIIYSLDHAGVCETYGCAKDPANPSSIAWGLEWSQAAGSGYTCYSPRTTTLDYRQYILLPRWTPPTDGSVKIPLVEEWNALAKVIYIHEAGHVAIDKDDIAALNAEAQKLPTCAALFKFWNDPHVFDKLSADQLAYHARLRADCRPEVGCIPPGWMGW